MLTRRLVVDICTHVIVALSSHVIARSHVVTVPVFRPSNCCSCWQNTQGESEADSHSTVNRLGSALLRRRLTVVAVNTELSLLWVFPKNVPLAHTS